MRIVLLLLFLSTAGLILGETKVVTWEEGQPHSAKWFKDGLEYRVVSIGILAVMVTRPVQVNGSSGVALSVKNLHDGIVNSLPSQIRCYCYKRDGWAPNEVKRMEPPLPPPKNTFLANTLRKDEVNWGWVLFDGLCDRYILRWTITKADNSVTLEFPFEPEEQ